MGVSKLSVLLVLALAIGALPPTLVPVHISYVNSNSMAPAIGVNDGYLLGPATDVERGDVIVFRSPQRDTYVTHRVVGETAAGYVTKGDNNPVTDQAAGFDPVPDSRVVGEVVTVGGSPLVVPGLGVPLSLLQEFRYLIVAVVVALFAVGRLPDSPAPERRAEGR